MFGTLGTYIKLLPYAALAAVIIYLSISNIGLKAELITKDSKIQTLIVKQTNLVLEIKNKEEECLARIFEAQNNQDWQTTVEEMDSIGNELSDIVVPLDTSDKQKSIVKEGEYTL